jgi:ribosomal-protein-alanine N-acetyltransferase
MSEIKVYTAINRLTEIEKGEIINFLHLHLGEYGDDKTDIGKAISYSLKETISFGGFTTIISEGDKILGAAVVNATGMSGYIPENILVYIATHSEHRGEGLGKRLMETITQHAKGDIALHVEANNPAKKLYEKFNFTNPYLEMRLKRQK